MDAIYSQKRKINCIILIPDDPKQLVSGEVEEIFQIFIPSIINNSTMEYIIQS